MPQEKKCVSCYPTSPNMLCADKLLVSTSDTISLLMRLGSISLATLIIVVTVVEHKPARMTALATYAQEEH